MASHMNHQSGIIDTDFGSETMRDDVAKVETKRVRLEARKVGVPARGGEVTFQPIENLA